MTLFDADGWQTDLNTDCLNDSLFGHITAAHKKNADRRGLETPSEIHKNRNAKLSGKKGPKCPKNEEKQIVPFKKYKSHGSSESRSALKCDPDQTHKEISGMTKAAAQLCPKQLQQTKKCERKRKPNKRNKYRHLVLNTTTADVEVKSEHALTENKEDAKQKVKIKRTETTTDDVMVENVTKRKLSIDATYNTQTVMKKKKKLKKEMSGLTKDSASEEITGIKLSAQKRHPADDARKDTEAESTAAVTSTKMRKNQREGNHKQKCKTDELKHPKKVATLTKNGVNLSSSTMSSPIRCVKGKAVTTSATAASATKQQRHSPFNIAKLKAVFQHETSASANRSKRGMDNESKTQRNTMQCKSNSKTATKSSTPQTLRERMQEKLSSARFRYINEQLYTRTGEEARRLFTEDLETFQVYHEGYQSQIAKWPVNPVKKVIEYISARPESLVVADLGCGDATVSTAVPNRVFSFDLVAVNDSVTACDISNVPLDDNSVDIAVFCLSLMGTDFALFLCEANRILRMGGRLLVAEVVSRFDKIGAFVRKLAKLGFSLQEKDTSNKMFVWFEFMKIGKPDIEKLPKIVLMPCLYKKR